MKHAPERQRRLGFQEARVVRDFNTLDDLINHAARDLGATYVSGAGPETKIYFSRGGDYPYEEASVRRKGGYWHADGPGAREGVKRLPAGAKPIAGYAGRRAAEAPRHHKKDPNIQAGERLRIRIEGPEGQVFETFSYTLDYVMSLDDVALRFSQTLQPGMRLVISSGHEKWIFQKETHGGQNAIKRLQETPGAAEPQFKLGAPRPGTSVRAAIAAGRDRRKDQYEYPEDLRKGDIMYGNNGEEYEVVSDPVETANGTVQIDLLINGVVTPRFFDIGMATWPIKRRASKTRESHSVRDYEAVDNRGRRIAGPSKSYSDMKRAAGTGGHVKYVRPGASEARRGKGFTPVERAQAAGEKYAVMQIQTEHFDDFVRDQLIEASKMPEDQVLPLKTPDDARKIARNILQQLEWDIKRDSDAASEIERYGVDVTQETEQAFFRGVHKALQDSVPWLADTLLILHREIRGAAEARPRPKARRKRR